MSEVALANTQCLNLKLQDLMDAYRPPRNSLEIDIFNLQTLSIYWACSISYELCMRLNLLIFTQKDKNSYNDRGHELLEETISFIDNHISSCIKDMPFGGFVVGT